MAEMTPPTETEIGALAADLIRGLLDQTYCPYYYFDNPWLHICLRLSRVPRRALAAQAGAHADAHADAPAEPVDVDIVQLEIVSGLRRRGIGTALVRCLAAEADKQCRRGLFIEQAITEDSKGLVQRLVRHGDAVCCSYYPDCAFYRYPLLQRQHESIRVV